MNKDDEFLTPKELSEMLKLSVTKLAIDRMKNIGIPFFKYMEGHRYTVRYPMSEVREFINNNKFLLSVLFILFSNCSAVGNQLELDVV